MIICSIGFIICITISLWFSVDYYWLYDIIPDQSNLTFLIATNKAYTDSAIAQALEYNRLSFRAVAVVTLIILNLTLVYAYKNRMNRLQHMSISSQETVSARKDANKELVILCVCQSCITLLEQIPQEMMQAIRHRSDFWAKCGLVMSPEANGASLMADVLKFFIILVNRKLRRDVVKIWVICKRLCCGNTAPNQAASCPEGTPQKQAYQAGFLSGSSQAGRFQKSIFADQIFDSVYEYTHLGDRRGTGERFYAVHIWKYGPGRFWGNGAVGERRKLHHRFRRTRKPPSSYFQPDWMNRASAKRCKMIGSTRARTPNLRVTNARKPTPYFFEISHPKSILLCSMWYFIEAKDVAGRLIQRSMLLHRTKPQYRAGKLVASQVAARPRCLFICHFVATIDGSSCPPA